MLLSSYSLLVLSTSFTTDYDEKTVTSFIDGIAERDIPLSVFHFDCYWMPAFHWCDFGWDKECFPDIKGTLKRYHEKGLKILLNPSPCNESLSDQPLELVDYFFINEVEGEMLSGSPEPEEILKNMKAKYPKSNIVLTLGSTGAYYYDGTNKVFCPARKVKAVDTVGAGDTFMGYFTYALSKGLTPAECMEIATKASSITVQRYGAAAAIPTIDEVNALD